MEILNPALAIMIFTIAIISAKLITNFIQDTHKSLSPNSKSRFEEVNGLRGFLATGVFIHHAVINWFYINTGKIDLPPSNFYAQLGQVGVALFFMITSFLFWGQLIERGEKYNWKSFFITRLFRIYPLYIALMAVVITAVFHESSWQLQSPPLDIFTQIIQWTVFDRPDINSYQNTGMIISNVTWTLNYEVFFYTTLPILYLAIFKSSNWKTILLCILSLYFLYSIFSWSHSLKKNIIMSFAGGVIAAYWIRNPWLLNLARSRLAGALGLTSLVLVLSAFNRSFAVVPLFLITVFFITIASGNKLFFY
jgi:peptidoglycan/LPS O-acetylase OafA/YrhL